MGYDPCATGSRKLGPDQYRFVHLRTKLAVDYSDEVFEKLPDEWATKAELMLFPDAPKLVQSVYDDKWYPEKGHPGGDTWEDGAVLRLESRDAPKEIATALSTFLDGFDAWAVHDGIGACVESMGQGPLTRYFRTLDGAKRRSALIFVRHGEDDKRAEDNVNLVMAKISPSALPVFHFRDGKVLMTPGQPMKVMVNRVGNLRKRLTGFAGCDVDGEPFVSDYWCEDLWAGYSSIFNPEPEYDDFGYDDYEEEGEEGASPS